MGEEKLREIYKLLGVEQQEAKSAIADLITYKSSLEADIFALANIDFGIPKVNLKDKSIAEILILIQARARNPGK